MPMNTLLTPLPKSPPLPRYATRLLGAGLAATAYVVCLPWDLRNRAGTPGAINETSPVTALGLTTFVLALVLLSAYFGLRDRPVWTLLVTAAPPSTLMFFSFDTHPTPDADAWQLAWAFFALLMGVGVLVVGALAARFGERGDTGTAQDG
ncbi:hypothetical protein AB0B50_35185 [Streptomyces sp. NPDC041068]|uniref:hypothetical protein n=1 Tax=Streptomyces sp. NPDC041068 TaxID=3155130 RepID=UPI0034035C8A